MAFLARRAFPGGAARRVLLVLVALAGFAGMAGVVGCGPAYGRFDYAPMPGEIVPQHEPEARVLVSVMGVRERVSEADRRPALDVRVLIENAGRQTLRFDPRQATAHTGDLVQLDRPSPEHEPLVVEPGDALARRLLFPFPEGQTPRNVNMNGLNVQIPLEVGEEDAWRTERHSISFQRDHGPAALRAAQRPRTGVHMGVGATHRMR